MYMYLIDTHCHLHDREFFTPEQAEAMLARARTRGIAQIICISTNEQDSAAALAFAQNHKNVFCSWGIHPEEASRHREIESSTASEQKLVCIGEIGLDYHYEGYDRQAQIALLEQMLDLVVKLGLPCSFHVRDAFSDFFAIARNFPALKPSILHSFTDTPKNLQTALNQGFYIGLNGIATFAHLACYKNLTPDFLDHCVLETDAPFLTPAPNRGKINEPGNIKDIATWLAHKLGVSSDLVAEKTTHNARKIFHLPDPEPDHDADPRAQLS